MCQSYHPSMSLKKCKPLKVKSSLFNLYQKNNNNACAAFSPASSIVSARKAAPNAGVKRRSVQFSTDTQTTFVDTTSNTGNNASNLYYTPSEISQFRRQKKQTIKLLHLRYTFASENPQLINVGEAAAFEGCVLTGIENQLTPVFAAKAVKRRGAVIKAVLEEQARQRLLVSASVASVAAGEQQLMVDGVELLAQISRAQSKGSIKRAKAIGFHQSK